MTETPLLARLIHTPVTGCTQGLTHCVVHVPDMGMKKTAMRVAKARAQ